MFNSNWYFSPNIYMLFDCSKRFVNIFIIMQAIRNALQKLEAGGSVEDAKAICGPEIVDQIMKWKVSISLIQLSPLLNLLLDLYVSMHHYY